MTISYLFIPGNSERKMIKGFQSSADAIILDLEDAVLPDEKYQARQLVVQTLQHIQSNRQKVFVRINSYQTEWFIDDVAVLSQLPMIDGIMLPKSENKEGIMALSNYLTEKQELIPLIESAKGIYNFNEIVSSSNKIKRVAFGAVDYALDLGTEWSVEGLERQHAMGTLTIASRALGIEPPIDAVFPIIDDTESFIRDTEKGKNIGFYGKLIIHPKHIDLVKKVYAPSPQQIEWSRKVVEVFEKGTHNGAAQLDGKLIDLPVYLLAKRIIGQVVEV